MNLGALTEGQATNQARCWALIALSVYLLEKMVMCGLRLADRHLPWLAGVPTIPIAAALFSWVVPLWIAYRVEGRDRRSLGLTVGRDKYLRYSLYSLVGLVLPGFFLGIDRGLIVEFLEQVVYIGLAEEVFFRGYLMTRFCEWLGTRKGLLLNGLLFGLGHVISLVSQHGFNYLVQDAWVGLYTFLGGLLHGAIYLRAGNIVPSAIVHVSANMYLGRILELFGWSF